MSSAPFLKLTVTASLIAPEACTTPHAGRDLDKDETGALRAFLERVGQAQIDQVAETPLEAHLMYEALAKVRWIVASPKSSEVAPLKGAIETLRSYIENSEGDVVGRAEALSAFEQLVTGWQLAVAPKL